jgi:hypothetical protein
VWAVTGLEGSPVRCNGRIIGVRYEDESAEYCRLGGILPGDVSVAEGVQAMSVFEQMEAGLETGIGLRYQLLGHPKGARVLVDVVVRHPAIVNPDTQLPMTMSTARYERVIGEVEHSVWSFDTPGDLVPGEYVIEIQHKGRVLAREVFRVSVRED